VLFVGNSLTASNDLPAMVDAIARASGAAVASTAIVFPGVSLEDHWMRGDALRAIERGGWTFVVLQQGPSALPDSRVQLRASVRRFDERVRRAGARTALYMVWPASSRSGDFDAVIESYARAASDVGARLIPSGDRWRAAWRRDPSLALYGPDGFHPSPLGSCLAAATIVRALTGRSVQIAPALRRSNGAFAALQIPPATAALLAAIVNEWPTAPAPAAR
jgi:hypothetical protein